MKPTFSHLNFNGTDIWTMSPFLTLMVGILVLILCAAFCRKESFQRGWIISFITLGIALGTLFVASESQNLCLNHWLRCDSYAHVFSYFILCIGISVIVLTISDFTNEFYAFLLAGVFGLLLVAQAADFLTLFLGIETLSLSSYILCAYLKENRLAMESGIKYFLTGSVAAAFFLYGVALIYGATGTTQLSALRVNIESHSPNFYLLWGGLAFISVGLCFKAAIFPFHFYASDVYEGASNPVAAFITLGAKAGAFMALAEVFILFAPSPHPLFIQGIVFLSLITLIYANGVMIQQTRIRRFIAYSGISHAGFMLILIAVGTLEALSALESYVIMYASATWGVFACLNRHINDIADLQGLFYKYPLRANVLTVCLLTLAGIPPTWGFFAKFYIFKVAFESGFTLWVIVSLLTTLFSLFAYMRLISMLFTQKQKNITQEIG